MEFPANHQSQERESTLRTERDEQGDTKVGVGFTPERSRVVKLLLRFASMIARSDTNLSPALKSLISKLVNETSESLASRFESVFGDMGS